MLNRADTSLYDRVKKELIDVGYVGNLIQEDYKFADILSSEYSVESIPLAAFAQDPPSYRNACFGVVTPNGFSGSTLVSKYRSLGAPQVFEIDHRHLTRWKMTGSGEPQFLDRVEADDVPAMFERHKNVWSPTRILRAKSAGHSDSAQLDFFDTGLLPVLEHEARDKLDRLLRKTVNSAIHEFQNYSEFTDKDYPLLFRLLFRLIAAKVLGDRGHPGDWIKDDPRSVINAVQDFYFNDATPEDVLDHDGTQRVAWEHIKNAFHFQNLSVDALAYVYENTLVAKDTRRMFGIHSTPPEIAEYITRQLPFEDLDINERRVFEPFAGHAVFLVAAMQRLRELLPTTMSVAERHRYFVKMLSGIEIDDFANEVARLSLMLADYPNPDGWRLYAGDALSSSVFEEELTTARIVLCNPPFENFTIDERTRYQGVTSVRKPAAILSKVLNNPPDLLGFVLPRSFATGLGYRRVRSLIGQTYSSIDMVALPDQVFSHSDADAVLLLASKISSAPRKIRTGIVEKNDLSKFYLTHATKTRTECEFEVSPTIFRDSMWEPPLRNVWQESDKLQLLDEFAEIHRGIEYNIPFRGNHELLISKNPRPGFSVGVHKVKDSLEPFVVGKTVYLNSSPELMKGNAYRRIWIQPKLIVNSARRTRGAWRLMASIDHEGIVCYQNFHGLWPKKEMSLETLSAILNGPVANAFVATREYGRDIKIQTLKRIPVPVLDAQQDYAIASTVREYVHFRTRQMQGDVSCVVANDVCKRLLAQIDALVLIGYDFSPRTERSLLDYFAGHARPAPVDFREYFPPQFKPYIPWHRYISEEMDEASAISTLNRLPVIDDPLVSDAIRDL